MTELGTFLSSNKEPAFQIVLAGIVFTCFELLFRLPGPRKSLKNRFNAASRESSKDLDAVVRQATCRLVGTLHLVVQIPLALLVLWSSGMQTNRIYATTKLSRFVTATSAGYFLYDLYICVFRWEGPAYLLHGVTCSTLFCYASLTGFLHYYAALFLMWELSTPFVYARWFLFELGRSRTRLYVVNGLAMLASFFLARNVMGLFMLVAFFKDSGSELASPRKIGAAMPAFMLWVYRIACLTLTCLNAMWFSKMLKGALKVLNRSNTPQEQRARPLSK